MDGVRTAEGGEEVTGAIDPGSNLGRREVGGGLQALWGAPMAAYSGCGEGDGGIGHGERRSRTGLARVGGAFGWPDGGSVADGRQSGWEWNDSQSGQGATELGFPWPALGQMQGQPARRAGESPGQGEEASPEGLGGHYLLAQAEPGRPAGQVVGHHLYRQPGGVGGEAARGEMVEPDAVLEVSDGVLDLGVAAMISLQFQGVSPSRSVMQP